MKPTQEQQAVIDAALTGKNLKVEAGAGTGKTSTLVLVAEALHDKRIAYVAYNKAIADEAKGRFPKNTVAKTAHAFAFAETGRKYAKRLNTSHRVRLADVAKFLRIWNDLQVGERTLDRYTQTRLAQDMVAKFCKSADDEIGVQHLPYIEGIEPQHRRMLARHLLPYARKAWDDLQSTDPYAVLRFTHDHYLKIWALGHPHLDFDVILFDEAQDANPVIDGIIAEQTHAQRIYVGDRAQAIYGWNGAIDAMDKFDAEIHLYLSQSFRYGQGIADAGNRWLERLGTPLRLTGLGPDSTVGDLDETKAVLTRTNAGALQTALNEQSIGRKVHLVGGSADIEGFCKGALDLQTRGFTSHRDLSVFKSWSEVEDFSQNDPDGSDMAMLVRLVDEYSAQAILNLLHATVTEKDAQVVISTAHKAKGREWESVRIGNDFAQRRNKETGELVELTSEEIMLRYVAVTRAKIGLDPGPLTEGTDSQS